MAYITETYQNNIEFWIHHIQWIIFSVANSKDNILIRFFSWWQIDLFIFAGEIKLKNLGEKNSTQFAKNSSWNIWSWLNHVYANMTPTAWELDHTHIGGPPGPATGFCGGADLNKSQLTWNIHIYIWYHNHKLTWNIYIYTP